MVVEIDKNDPEQLAAYFNSETAKISWSELERFYAQGVVLHVKHPLDLVDVAVKLAQDDAATFSNWIEKNQVGRMADDVAAELYASQEDVWAVVAAPWVLVQLVASDL